MSAAERDGTIIAGARPKKQQRLHEGQDRLLGRQDAKGRPYGARSSIKKRSVVIEGRKTSISLEDEFWDEAKKIAQVREQTMHAFVADVLAAYDGHNFSSALRLAVLKYFRANGPVMSHQTPAS